MSSRRRCNLDGGPISPQDQAYIDAFAAELQRLADPPWWWQMTGRTADQWTGLDHLEQLAAHRPI